MRETASPRYKALPQQSHEHSDLRRGFKRGGF